MPRLLIDALSLTPQLKGVGRYTYHVIDQLSRRLGERWRIGIVTSHASPPAFTGPNFPEVLAVTPSSDVAAGLISVPRVILAYRPEVVILPRDYGVFTLGRRTLCIVHDITELIRAADRTPRTRFRIFCDLAKEHHRRTTIRRSASVLCNSEFTAREAIVRYGLKADRVRVAYCGIDPRFYQSTGPRAAEIWPILRQWDGYVVAFATGDPRENYELYPDFWARFSSQRARIGLVVAGIRPGAHYVNCLQVGFAKRGLGETEVLFVPFLGEESFDKLRALYRDADFYIELSGHEGFGMQLAEAMATGTTCISSERGALAEVAGEYAITLPALRAEVVASTLATAYRKELHLRDNAAQIKHTDRFNWNKVGELLESEVTQLQ